MNTTRKGINMTEEDIEALIRRKEEALEKQQLRKEKLERTMENTCNDLDQLRYTLNELKRIRRKRRPRTFVPHARVSECFAHLSALLDRLQHRTHRMLNNVWFCILINARYTFQSRLSIPSRQQLTPGTIMGYFKMERGVIK